MATLIVNWIKATNLQDSVTKDETRVEIDGRAYGPYSCKKNKEVRTAIHFPMDGDRANIELFEEDRNSNDDFLGSHLVRSTDGKKVVTFDDRNNAEYKLEYEVEA